MRRARLLAELTQAELAAGAGVTRQTIVAVEAGDYAPSVYLALAIAERLGSTVEELFGQGDDARRGRPGGHVSTVDANPSHNWFVRAAAVIGDLSNPFYREERQRDVWNEASAVAFQVLIWLHLSAATAVVWFVGEDALPYVYGLIAIIGVASWIALLYAASLGVHVDSRSGWRAGAWCQCSWWLVLVIG